MTVENGSRAPGFTLRNSEGKEVSFHELINQKRLLIHFFPIVHIEATTRQFCKIRDNMKFYREMGVEVVAISVDRTDLLQAYKQTHNFNFQLLSDSRREASEIFGCLLEQWRGYNRVSNHALFLIDTDASVLYKELSENPEEPPDLQALLRVVLRT